MICTDNLKLNSSFVIENIKQSNQGVLRRKLEKGVLIDINNFIANIKRNDAESSDYIFKLVRQIDLTEELKGSYPRYLGDFIWNIFDDSLLSERYSQIINSFELTGNIITSDLKDFNHFLWALFQISKELSEIFFGENILENRLDKKGSIWEKLRLIRIFRSADHTLTKRIVRIRTSKLQSEITESEEGLRNWFEEHIDSSKRNSGFGVALALKGALIVDANWLLPFIRANFGEERVIKCLEKAEAKTDKSKSLKNGILGWLNNARSRTFADLDRAKSYHWEGETYLRLKKFADAKKSFSEAEELFINSKDLERAFDPAYRHIYAYILEEEESGIIDYESYFKFLKEFLERYKGLSAKEYPIHEKQIDYYKNKAKWYYKNGDFDTACKFSKEAYEYADKIHEKYPTKKDVEQVIRLNKAFYWRAKAKGLEKEQFPKHSAIAECYEKAARNSEEMEKYMDHANCYKHKAIASNEKNNLEKFFENIAKSIESETKLGVEEVKMFLEGLKNEDGLVFSYIDNLAKSVDDFFGMAYLFGWDRVPGNDSERLIRYLMYDLGISWAKNAKISKSDDGKSIFIKDNKNSVKIKIDEKKKKVTLKISDGRTHDLKVNGKVKIYEPDKIWGFLSLIIQSEKTVYYYREGNKDTSKVSRAGYEYAKELYEKYPSEDIERMVSLNKAFYERAFAKIKEQEQEPDHYLIARYYEKAARISDNYDKSESSKDWVKCYAHRRSALKEEPKQLFDEIRQSLEFVAESGNEKAKKYLEFLRQDYLRSLPEIVKEFYNKKNFEGAYTLSTKIDKLLGELFGEHPPEDIELVKLKNKTLYWRAQAELSLKETQLHDYFKIADAYKKAAEASGKYDERGSYEDRGNCYKYRALTFKNKPATFIENISKAIEFANKAGDKKAESDLADLKHKRLVAFFRIGDFEERKRNLGIAKAICYRKGDEKTGKLCEFLLSLLDSYNQLERATVDEEMKKAFSALETPLKIVEEEDIYANLAGEIQWSRGNFPKASDFFKKWLESEGVKKGISKKEYKSYEILKKCSDILSKDKYTNSDFKDIDELSSHLMNNPSLIDTYAVVELLRSRVVYILKKVPLSFDLTENKYVIIKVFSRKIIVGNRELGERVEKAVEEIEREIEEGVWLSKLPEIFLEKFDERRSNLFRAINLDVNPEGEIQRLESSLEFFLRVIAEFNAKILWGYDWQKHVRALTGKDLDFSNLTFGECFNVFKHVLKEGMKKYGYYYNIDREIINLLEQHLPLRRDLSHEKRQAVFEDKEKEPVMRYMEILKIMYHLLPLFPLCLNVKSTHYTPCNATLLWRMHKKNVDLNFDGNLNEGEIYYTDQKSFEIQKKEQYIKLNPAVLITATVLKKYLEIENNLIALNFVGPDYGKTHDVLSQVIPQDAIGWFRKASSLYNLGENRYEEALESLDECLKLDSQKVPALIKRGVILEKLGNNGDALKCFEDALSIDDKNGLAWYNKGLVLSNLGKYPDAIPCYDNATKCNPFYAPAWSKKGEALSNLRKREEAIKCYERSLLINGENVFIWIKKGETFSELGEHDEALRCFDRVLEFNPAEHEKVIALHNKGVVLSKREKDERDERDEEEAIKCFDTILNELYPQYVPAWNNKGRSLAKLGKHKEAIECYIRAIKIDSDNATAWNNKGRAFENLKEYKEAIESYAETLKILGTSSDKKFTSDVWINKGRAYENWGDECSGADRKEKYEKALECYESVLEIKPDKTDERKAWKNKGKVLKKLERYEEASECFKEIPSKGRLMNILREIHKYPEDYKLFKQGFEAEFEYHTEKVIHSKEEQGALRKKFYDLLFMSLEEASEESPFETTAKIFKSCQIFCEDISGKELKDRLTIRFRHYMFSFFRDIIFGTGYHNIGPVESKEELNTLLEKFEITFEETGIETPSLEEIKEVCIRSEKYAEHGDKVERIFGL